MSDSQRLNERVELIYCCDKNGVGSLARGDVEKSNGYENTNMPKLSFLHGCAKEGLTQE